MHEWSQQRLLGGLRSAVHGVGGSGWPKENMLILISPCWPPCPLGTHIAPISLSPIADTYL